MSFKTNKYPRTPHFKFSPGAKNDDRIADNHSNFIGKEIIITEKLDGGNIGLTKNGVYARSHATFTSNPWDVKVRELHSNIGYNIPDDMYIFGEGMEAIHSIEYTNLTSTFYVFGIREDDMFLSWDEVVEYSYLLDLPLVPVLFRGIMDSEEELEKLVQDLSSKESKLGGELEGVVVRISSGFKNNDFDKNVIKWVREGHVQTDSHWTRNWKKAKINYESK